jgi:hypothetical protein
MGTPQAISSLPAADMPLVVQIGYTDGRVECTAPLAAPVAQWFAAMMRASHADILKVEILPCATYGPLPALLHLDLDPEVLAEPLTPPPPVRIMTVCTTVYLPGTDEWQVKAYDQHHRRYADADYFTDDKADALSTMIAMLDNTKPAGMIVAYNATKRCAWLTKPEGGHA